MILEPKFGVYTFRLTVGDELDADEELELASESDVGGKWQGTSTWLTRDETRELRDHLSNVLGDTTTLEAAAWPNVVVNVYGEVNADIAARLRELVQGAVNRRGA